MKTTIVSSVLNRTITFSGKAGGHIYADLNGHPGGRGNKIRAAGKLKGEAIRCGATQDDFQTQCNNWYRSYVRNHPDRVAIDCNTPRKAQQVIGVDALLARIQRQPWQHAATVLEHFMKVNLKPRAGDERYSEFGSVLVTSRSDDLKIIYQEMFDRDILNARPLTRSGIANVPSFQVGGAVVKKTLTDTHPMDPFALSEVISEAVGHAFCSFDYTSYFEEQAQPQTQMRN
ncbi:hypothetical protein SAMN05444339_11550 [Loktanella atrilutea]|uniref:Uncharacterized protein n=1 Tax=Loktanella atrilutea TaxID=366533 RepID=A0A1M5EXX2_LOKAT|nr:hypothetical protein [Loktanella atrilutea]SHF84089.1 hypothetical protein SAMN05444339_11550 [Loktanella atrilutea]